MNLFAIAVASTLLSATQAAASFKSTCSTASNQMYTLGTSIAKIKATANKYGHYKISQKCDEASQHLGYAQSSWNRISSSYGSSPWQARSSTHGNEVRQRMSSCGSALQWIYGRSEVSRYPEYGTHVKGCRTTYDSCQSTCSNIWDWPSPPGYYPPKPSQYSGGYYRRQRRDSTEGLCPAAQTACPISPTAAGHECIETDSEITSCGGCASLNEGENCMAIPGADEVGCEFGHCRVFSTRSGYVLNSFGRPELARPVSTEA